MEEEEEEEREKGIVAEEEVREEGVQARCLMKCGGDLKREMEGGERTVMSLMGCSVEIWCIIFYNLFLFKMVVFGGESEVGGERKKGGWFLQND